MFNGWMPGLCFALRVKTCEASTIDRHPVWKILGASCASLVAPVIAVLGRKENVGDGKNQRDILWSKGTEGRGCEGVVRGKHIRQGRISLVVRQFDIAYQLGLLQVPDEVLLP